MWPKRWPPALEEEPDEAEGGPMSLRKFIDPADAVGPCLRVLEYSNGCNGYVTDSSQVFAGIRTEVYLRFAHYSHYSHAFPVVNTRHMRRSVRSHWSDV